MLAGLVAHRLVLDQAALIPGLHRPQHPAPVGDPLELGQHRLLDQVGQLLDQVGTLQRVVDAASPHSLSMISWIASARRTEAGEGVVTASSKALVCRLLALS